MATQASVRFLTPAEVLQIDFGPDLRAELDNGVVRMMAGGSREHSRVQTNLLRWFGNKLRGSGCRPHGSDAAVQTTDTSIRYPDMTIDCGPDEGPVAEAEELVLADPRLIVEVLSPGTRAIDEGVKLIEYRQVDSLRTILLIDPVAQRVRVLARDSASERWRDQRHDEAVDIELAPFGLMLPHAEIFARD
jgi:Uma2 family endonuclease